MLIPALPTLVDYFHINYGLSSWLLTAYLVSAAVMTPIAGKLSDIYGRKRVLLVIMLIYTTGVIIGAISNDIYLMIDETESIYDKYGDKIKENDFKEHPERFIHLCNGSVVEKSSGFTYPLLSNGTIEVDEPFHLASIDNEEWWESLCDDDKIELNKTYS